MGLLYKKERRGHKEVEVVGVRKGTNFDIESAYDINECGKRAQY